VSGVGVRRYQPQDLPGLMEVRISSIRGVASRDYTPEQIDAWIESSQDREAQARRFGEKTLTWVGCDDGKLAGFINLAADGYLDCLYVHADNQRRGVASALMAALEQEARLQRQARIHSEVSLTARLFFEAQGFVVTTPQRVTVNGQTYDNLRMEKWL
jgi:putative acetyltransferase